MKHKLLILFILFILSTISVFAVECGDTFIKNGDNVTATEYCSLNSGVQYKLYTTKECEGQMTISVRTKLENKGYYFNDFTRQNENIWTGDCKDGMSVIFKTDNRTVNEFDIVIEYYTKEKVNTDDKDKDEIHNSLYRKTLTFSNIRIDYKVEDPNVKIFSIENVSDGIYIVIFVFIIIIIIVIVVGRYFYNNIFNDKSNSVEEEKKHIKSLNEEIDDILKDVD